MQNALCFCLLTLYLAVGPLPHALSSLPAQPPPNIVWLVTEDNSVHYSRLYTPGGAPMPHVEALARRGLTFANAYSQAPVCSVARSTLISGSYAPRVGAHYHRKEVAVPMPPGLDMFPTYLRRAGYYTANNAKEDYNLIKWDDVWDESSSQADYRDRAPGQPFFYVHNFHTTHESSLHFPRADTVAVTDDADSLHLPPVYPDTEAFRYTLARYHDRHRQVDREIGELLDRLEADGLMDSTIIFVYGDHGGVLPGSKGYLNELGLHVPLVVYVPKAYRHLSPYAPGSRPQVFARFMDFGPTMLNLAGTQVPEEMDGRAFLGEHVRNPDPAQDTVYSYADRFDEKADLVRAVRIGRFKYIRNYQPHLPDGLNNEYRYRMWAYQDWREAYRRGELDSLRARFFRPKPPELLYDLAADPYETRNLANKPAYAAPLRAMRRALQEKARSLPDLGFIPESVFLAEATENPTAYGRANRDHIARLIEVADLQLLPYPTAAPALRQALTDDDPLVRYWSLTAATAFGTAARELASGVRDLRDDDHPLVRLRAIEFLGVLGEIDPRPDLTSLLTQTGDPYTAVAILNIMSYFKFTNPEWEWQLPNMDALIEASRSQYGKKGNVERLMDHLR